MSKDLFQIKNKIKPEYPSSHHPRSNYESLLMLRKTQKIAPQRSLIGMPSMRLGDWEINATHSPLPSLFLIRLRLVAEIPARCNLFELYSCSSGWASLRQVTGGDRRALSGRNRRFKLESQAGPVQTCEEKVREEDGGKK